MSYHVGECSSPGDGGVRQGASSLVRDDSDLDVSPSDDWRDIALESYFAETHPEQFLLTQKAYLNRLCDLHPKGLTFANLLILMRTWSQGASTHILRHVLVQDEWAKSVDDQIISTLEKLLDVDLDEGQRSQVFLKIEDGGLGMGSAQMRREAAYLGAWEGGMKPLLGKLAHASAEMGSPTSTVQALRRLWPQ